MKNWKAMIALALTAVLLAGAIWLPVAAQTISLSGTLATDTIGSTTLSLTPEGAEEALYTQKVKDGTYSFSGVTPGTYILKAINGRRVMRSYTVAIGEDPITQDIKLCRLGDASLDSKINIGDVAKTYAHVRKTALLTDEYALTCADITCDTRVNVGDTAKIYALVRNPQPEEPEEPEPTDPSDLPDWTPTTDPFGSTTPIDPFEPFETVEPEKDYPVPSNPVVDNEGEPVEIGGTLEFEAPVQAGHLVHYWIYRVSETSLVINDPNVYVIYDGVTYTPENGILTVPKLLCDSTQIPVKLAIGNKGVTDKTYTVTLSYPQGHQMNPHPLSNGNLTTFCEEGSSQGVYYSFTAETSGELKVTIKRVEGAESCNVILTSKSLIGGTRSESTEDNGTSTVSMSLAQGETVIVNIVVNPENGFNYPEATITTTVRFR